MLTTPFSCLWPRVCWCPEAFVKEAEIPVFWTGSPMPNMDLRTIDCPEIQLLLEEAKTVPLGTHPERITHPSSVSASESKQAKAPSTHFRTIAVCALDKTGFFGVRKSEPQIKDEHIRHSLSQFSAHYKLLLHSCEEKEMVYLQSCSEKGWYYYYYKNKHKLLWYILSKEPLISPDFFTPKQPDSHFFSRKQKMQLFNGVFSCTLLCKSISGISHFQRENNWIIIANLDVLISGTNSASVKEFLVLSVFYFDWKPKGGTKKVPQPRGNFS